MVSMRKVLEQLGFEPDFSAMTDKQPGYTFDFGNLKLQVAEVFTLSGAVFLFGGIISTPRTLRIIDYQVPLEVETFELGIALIAYAIGSSFRPEKPTAWLEQGRLLKHHLPWMREKKAYDARPACKIGRDWFRLACKELRGMGENADAEAIATFSFDGRILTIIAADKALAMPAAGFAWDECFEVYLAECRALPKRLMSDPVWISVWGGRLLIEQFAMRILD